jgi:hypothetical protein
MRLITELMKRVAALEKLVQGGGQGRRRLSRRTVADQRDVSTRTLDRHVVTIPGFPQPHQIRGRSYWWEDELDDFDRRLLQQTQQFNADRKVTRAKQLKESTAGRKHIAAALPTNR